MNSLPTFELRAIRGERFLEWSRRWGRSSETGPVTSQYDNELKADAPEVQAFGLYACGHPVGAFSCGFHQLPRGGVAGRLDLVFTKPRLRGKGIGGFLIINFADRCVSTDGIRSLSTVAVHPAVRHVFQKVLHFDDAKVGQDVPLFRYQLTDDGTEFRTKVRAELRHRRERLKRACVQCTRFRWSDAWCASEGDPKPQRRPIPPEDLLRRAS